MQKSYVINGKFLSQRITGVQRYALEIVGALDKLTQPGQLEIAVPPNVKDIPQYQNIQIKRIGHLQGVLWEQISFPIYALRHGRIPLNLCNASPLAVPGVICIHDVKIRACPQYFSALFTLWYRILFSNAARRAYQLITVSEFSKNEIEKYYGKLKRQIRVVPSCWEHYARIGYDENAVSKYQLSSGNFYFALGSLDPDKNFTWIAQTARQYPEYQFAIAGSINEKVFSSILETEPPSNMRFLGYVSDAEAKTLMRECKAFLFPSFYEGFGLTPLEALSAGARCLVVSDIPVMHEMFGDSVNYIDPYDGHADLTRLSEISEAAGDGILKKYSWEKSARELLAVLNSL